MAKPQSFSKSGLVGKDVVDQEGNLVGTVKDVDLAIGKVALVVEDKDGETKTISWDMVQGAADCVILKPDATSRQHGASNDAAITARTVRTSCSTGAAVTVNSYVPDMWSTAHLDSSIQAMVLLQRPEVRLEASSSSCFFFLVNIDSEATHHET